MCYEKRVQIHIPRSPARQYNQLPEYGYIVRFEKARYNRICAESGAAKHQTYLSTRSEFTIDLWSRGSATVGRRRRDLDCAKTTRRTRSTVGHWMDTVTAHCPPPRTHAPLNKLLSSLQSSVLGLRLKVWVKVRNISAPMRLLSNALIRLSLCPSSVSVPYT